MPYCIRMNSSAVPSASADAYAVVSVSSASVSTLATSNFHTCPECLGVGCRCEFIVLCDLCCPCSDALTSSRSKRFYQLTEPITEEVKICLNCHKPKTNNGNGCVCESQYFRCIKGVNRACDVCASMLGVCDRINANTLLCPACGDVTPCSCVPVVDVSNVVVTEICDDTELKECCICAESKPLSGYAKYAMRCPCKDREMCDACVATWLKKNSTCPTCRFNNFATLVNTIMLQTISNFFTINYTPFVCDNWGTLNYTQKDELRNPFLRNLFHSFIERNVKWYDEVFSVYTDETDTRGLVLYRNIFRFIYDNHLKDHFPNAERRDLFTRFFIATDDGGVYSPTEMNAFKMFDFSNVSDTFDLWRETFKVYINVSFDKWEVYPFSFSSTDFVIDQIADEINNNIHYHDISDLIDHMPTHLADAFSYSSNFWEHARENEMGGEIRALIYEGDYAEWLRTSFKFFEYIYPNGRDGFVDFLPIEDENNCFDGEDAHDFAGCYYCMGYDETLNL